MAKAPAIQSSHLFERIAASVASLAILGLVIYLLIRNEPIADGRLFLALRIVLSLCAAILGATVPGFLLIDWSGRGLAIRARGALALFVLTFVFTPDLANPEQPNAKPTISAPGGVAAGTISNSPITVNPGSPQR